MPAQPKVEIGNIILKTSLAILLGLIVSFIIYKLITKKPKKPRKVVRKERKKHKGIFERLPKLTLPKRRVRGREERREEAPEAATRRDIENLLKR